MSDQREWKGQRIGPYRVGERYPGVAEDESQLHEAYHVETGAPALAVIPASGEDWRVPSPWRMRTTNFPDPGVLIVDTEFDAHARTPTSNELARGAILTAAALTSLDAVGQASTHFARKPSLHARHTGRRWGFAGAAVLLAMGLAWMIGPKPLQFTEASSAQGSDNSVSFINGTFTTPIAAYPMPEKAFKGQRKPPCLEGTEEEIRGGCWLQLAKTAPCPRNTAEYQGKCYMPTKEDPAPRSVEP